MSQYYGNQTSDLSASMTSSSIASDVDLTTSLISTPQNKVGCHDVLKPNGIDPSMVNLLTLLFNRGSFDTVLEISRELQEHHPKSIFLNNIIAESSAQTNKIETAIEHYKLVIAENPNLPNSYNNLAVAYKNLGYLDHAESHLKTALKLKPNFAQAFNNYGNVLSDRGDIIGAQKSFLKSIEIDPSKANAYWNLHSTVADIDMAKEIIELCLEKDAEYEPAIFTLATINAYKGEYSFLEWLLGTDLASHAVLRSIEWILSLPKLPDLHFNRWSVFDAAISMSDKSRPFYEYGVWMGESFKYLIKAYEKGYGFDTFNGLPEDWHTVPRGTYSSYGNIPKIKGGEFIVGEFNKTLPEFFAQTRPKASLINFDADLYSSTLCALTHSLPVIDKNTVLVFDELIVNEEWEKDEFRALLEFCNDHNFSYNVHVVSLFTKQVVITLSEKT
ncbi:tetratricopeptide repeat protein [Rhodobacteraceae bacterium nBUS_24]